MVAVSSSFCIYSQQPEVSSPSLGFVGAISGRLLEGGSEILPCSAPSVMPLFPKLTARHPAPLLPLRAVGREP